MKDSYLQSKPSARSRQGNPHLPRLLTLTPDFPPSIGGIQLLLKRLVEHLPSLDHLVVARGAEGEPDDPVRVVRTRAKTGTLSFAELNLRALLTGLRGRPDAILNGHLVTTPAAAILRVVLRRPVFTYVYADEVPAHPHLTRLAARASDRIIAISAHAQALVEAQTGPGLRPKIVLIAPGFDQTTVGHAATADGPPPTPTIVTVARLVDRYKGHDVVLQALPAVLRRVPDARWIVVGDGPLRPELEATARRLGVADSVTFTGRVPDAGRDAILRAASVFVMVSRLPRTGMGGEGFGIVYLEAALHGVPSVAGAVGGALDAIVHRETGLLVDPSSADAVADALTTLLTDEPLRAGLGQAARDRALHFSWESMSSQVERVVFDALDARGFSER